MKMKTYEVLIPNGTDEPIKKKVIGKNVEAIKAHIIKYITNHNLDVDIEDVTFTVLS